MRKAFYVTADYFCKAHPDSSPVAGPRAALTGSAVREARRPGAGRLDGQADTGWSNCDPALETQFAG